MRDVTPSAVRDRIQTHTFEQLEPDYKNLVLRDVRSWAHVDQVVGIKLYKGAYVDSVEMASRRALDEQRFRACVVPTLG